MSRRLGYCGRVKILARRGCRYTHTQTAPDLSRTAPGRRAEDGPKYKREAEKNVQCPPRAAAQIRREITARVAPPWARRDFRPTGRFAPGIVRKSTGSPSS